MPEQSRQIEELLESVRESDAELAQRSTGAVYAGDADPYRKPREATDDGDDEADGFDGDAVTDDGDVVEATASTVTGPAVTAAPEADRRRPRGAGPVVTLVDTTGPMRTTRARSPGPPTS